MRRPILPATYNDGASRQLRREGFSATAHKLCAGAELVLGQCQNYFFPRHTHAEYTVGIVLSGSESIYCRGGNQSAGSGSLYFARPDEIHTGQSIGQSSWRFASLYLSPAFYQSCFAGQRPDFNKAVQENPGSSHMYAEFVRLLDVSSCNVERQSALIMTVQYLTQNNMGGANIETSTKTDMPAINRSIEFMHANFAAPIKLKDIAGIAGFHPGYFVDYFAKSKETTPHAYLLSIRLNAAKKALKEGQKPAEAAASSGFYDQSHLNRHFARVFGMTPGQFRAQMVLQR